jgi:hypothetical protein
VFGQGIRLGDGNVVVVVVPEVGRKRRMNDNYCSSGVAGVVIIESVRTWTLLETLNDGESIPRLKV